MNQTAEALSGGQVPVVAKEAGGELAAALAALSVHNTEDWAQDNYERTVWHLARTFRARRLIEIGGGRDPLFDLEAVRRAGVDYTVNDISSEELARLPDGYHRACFDVAGDLSGAGVARNAYDLAFSRMVFEHVSDGRQAWSNVHQLLAPGGVGLAFMPTLYAFPFVVNWLLPDRLAKRIAEFLYPHRATEADPVFPARYSWTVALESRMKPMLQGVGFREVVVIPFYGHGYYNSLPVIRDLHARFSELARVMDWRLLASYAYIAARK
jgi:SAM-dependent methyltransferase